MAQAHASGIPSGPKKHRPPASDFEDGTRWNLVLGDGTIVHQVVNGDTWVKADEEVGSFSADEQTIKNRFTTNLSRPTGRLSYAPSGAGGGRSVGTVMLETDDAETETYNNTLPRMASRGLPWSIAVPVSVVGDSTHMSWAQLQEANAKGAEISAHSGGVNLVTGSESDIDSVTIDYKTAIESRGMACNRLVTAGTPDFESDIDFESYGGRMVEGLFESVGHVKGFSGNKTTSEGRVAVNGYADARRNIGELTQSQAEQVVDAVANSGSMCTLFWHPHKIGTSGQLTSSELNAVLDKIETMRNNGNLNVATPTGGRKQAGDLRDNHVNPYPSFTSSQFFTSGTGLANVWEDPSNVVHNTSTGKSDSSSMELGSGGFGSIRLRFGIPNWCSAFVAEGWARAKGTGNTTDLQVESNITGDWPDYTSGPYVSNSFSLSDTWSKFAVTFGVYRGWNAGQLNLQSPNNGVPALVDDMYVYPV